MKYIGIIGSWVLAHLSRIALFIWLSWIGIESYLFIGEVVQTHTFDWTTPLQVLVMFGGTAALGFVAGQEAVQEEKMRKKLANGDYYESL